MSLRMQAVLLRFTETGENPAGRRRLAHRSYRRSPRDRDES
jgi:hypothetical protein